MADLHVLKLFKAMVVEAKGVLDFSNIEHGFITDFRPTPAQLKILREEFKPLDVKTLFTVEEREHGNLHDLIFKQVLHYVEVYGLNSPGLFNLEQVNGQVATLAYIQGISFRELEERVQALLYANAPIKDAPGLKEVINFYHISFDLNKVKNNEMRVILFQLGKNNFESGDDAVRYMCYVATESPLLIKSKKVIKAIEDHGKYFDSGFFMDHLLPLAKVFHRHKNLILAAKTRENRGAINTISRLAKTYHVPVHEPLSKRFISEAYKDNIEDVDEALATMSLRDKFKFLNLISYKKLGNTLDAFVIRNGKVHLEKGREVLKPSKLDSIENDVLDSLSSDLNHLRGANVLLDEHVDYGLPISRKQVIGNLPFGTTVTPTGTHISAGIYWENAWGARDLDLSAVDVTGKRTGWGRLSGYDSRDVIFSGDVTSAHAGAMEFMTSKVSYKNPYALFVNIYNGKEDGSKFALVVGTKSKDHWIEDPVLREVGLLESRGNIIGFVKDGKFVVFSCRVNNSYWSEGGKEAALVSRGLADFWTLKRLFDALSIPYYVKRESKASFDHDLTYEGFSLDKLEAMFNRV